MFCGHKTCQKRVLWSRKKLQTCREATQENTYFPCSRNTYEQSVLLPRNKPQKFCDHISRQKYAPWQHVIFCSKINYVNNIDDKDRTGLDILPQHSEESQNKITQVATHARTYDRRRRLQPCGTGPQHSRLKVNEFIREYEGNCVCASTTGNINFQQNTFLVRQLPKCTMKDMETAYVLQQLEI